MRKETKRTLESNRDFLNTLHNRVRSLELQGKIETTRELTKVEYDNILKNTVSYTQPLLHTDIFYLKDIIELILDYLGLELKKTPEKTQLQAKKDGKKK